MNRRLMPIAVLLVFILSSIACELETIFPGEPTATPSKTTPTTSRATPVIVPSTGEQPVLITGEFTYSNDFVVETYFAEHAVALVDLHGFVIRDQQ